MKKVIVSLLVLAFVALAATGTVSAQCAAQTTTTNVATTCAQCTSCTTSTCCSCPTTCCCPTVACCVVTQCCEVKTVKAMHEMPAVKEAKEAKEVKGEEMGAAAAVATKGSAAVVGSGQASVAKQTIGDQTQTVGAITNSGDGSITVTFAAQTAVNANVPINVQIKDSQFNPAIAWGDSQAATNGGTNSASSTVTDLVS
jgi:hypothetical protein